MGGPEVPNLLGSAATLDAILQTSLDGVIIVDEAGLVRGWNHRAETIFGWQASEAVGHPIDQLVVPPRYRDVFRARLRLIVKGSDTRVLGRRFELAGMRKDGSELPIELGLLATKDSEEPVLVCFSRDLTPQKRAEAEIQLQSDKLTQAQERLHHSEELYRHVVELSGLIPWTADVDGQIVSVGERWTDWTGASIDAALANGWLGFLHPDDMGGAVSRWGDALRSGERLTVEYRVRFQSGDYRWCHARATRRPDGPDHHALWYGTLEDVHERRMASDAFMQAQAELAHVSRLSAMGAMASAIAHDLNQPLTAVANYVRGSRLLAKELEGSKKAEIDRALEDAERNTVWASQIVRRVRDFVARGSVDYQPEEIADLVAEACRFALVDAGTEGISYRLKLHSDCSVVVDRVQIQQVLVNLIRNAVEALKGQAHRDLLIRTEQAEPAMVEIAISDTGTGITAETAARMFDPLYSTRSDGMGIGLSISRMIVEAHGGTIWNASGPGPGSTIKFTLPCVIPAASPVPIPAADE